MEKYENNYLLTKMGVQNESNISTTTPEQNNSEMNIPLYIYIIVSLVNAAIFIVGTFGNILVIIVVLKFREMRKSTNMFLLNLSVADILVLFICQPAGLLEFFGKDRWFLGEILCKLVPLMENGVVHVSILTMIAVTFERYIALCYPFRLKLFYTVSSTIKSCIFIWIGGFTIALPFFTMTVQEDARFYDGSPIKVCRTIIDETWRYIYTIVIVIIFFVLPFFVLVGIYSKIIKQLSSDTLKFLTKNDKSALNSLKTRKQVVKMLIIIIVLFFLTLFPIRFVTLWLIFTPSNDVTKIGFEGFLNLISWTRILMYVNSACNPIIYSVTSSKFKKAFHKLFQRYIPNRFSSTMTIRCAGNENVTRPVVTYQQSRARERNDLDNRRGNSYFVIKLMQSTQVKNLHHDNIDGTAEDQHLTSTQQNDVHE